MWTLLLLFSLYALISVTGYALVYLNIRSFRAHGAEVPEDFRGLVDSDVLEKARGYIIDTSRFGLVRGVLGDLVVIAFIFLGGLGIYDSHIARWTVGTSFIGAGLIYFLPLFYAGFLLEVPFSIYRTFVIEKRYGFNASTAGLWAVDHLKALFISTVIAVIVLTASLYVIERSPGLWWFWLWAFYLGFTLFMMFISPHVIEPLFNEFTPVDDKELVDGIGSLMKRAGLRVSRVFRMDASRRTLHTNAYFTGVGATKRIVLYDTLIEKLAPGEILAVLAHEAGHWKRRHLVKRFLLMQAVSVAVFYASYLLMEGEALNELFMIRDGTFFSKAVVLGFVLSMVFFPMEPFFNYLSRKDEVEADEYSVRLTDDPGPMIRALVKLSKDNLANLHPHPLYVAFHYSHPPAAERIRRIREVPV